MKVIKVIFNNDTKFITDIISEIDIPYILEEYNISYIKDRKKCREMMERHGTRSVPLIIFEDENLKEYSAIWSEQKPDWKLEILKKLRE